MRKGRAPLFTPLSWVLARAPVLPVEAYLALSDHDRRAAFWPEPGAPRTPASEVEALALKVGAGHLASMIDERSDKAGSRSTDRDLHSKRLRYRIRMSTRPTPYGAFSGVVLCDTAAATVLEFDQRDRREARPDMEWLLSFIAVLEQRDEVLRQLALVAHSALSTRAGRIVLDDPTALQENAGQVSIGASAAAVAALDAARTFTRHDRLMATLIDSFGADASRAASLIRELVDQGLLLTELRPPLTCAAPAAHVLERLRSLPHPPAETAGLAAALEALSDWKRLEPGAAAAGFDAVDRRFVALHAGHEARVQVDLSLGSARATIGQPLLDIAAETADLLFKLTPSPHGSPVLRAFRATFIGRYGADRQVPLLELLDPQTGIGVPGSSGGSALDTRRLARRQAALESLAQIAMVERRHEVELDDALLARLALWEVEPEHLPTSIDLCLMVLAESAGAIDRGDWRVVLGPNVGARQAGRYLGRFAGLLGPRAELALQEATEAERRHACEAIWAESVYLPRRLRSANVTIRPAVRSHEIPLGVPAGVPAEQTIPISELAVGIRHERLCLFWRGREVRVCAGHMLTTFQAPRVSRFIEELGQDGVAHLSGFDWGPAAGYTFLPRVARGRAILAPGQWRLSKAALEVATRRGIGAFQDRLKEFRERWQMPRHVYLVAGDNRLLLDLDDAEQADQLRLEIAGRAEFDAIVLQEALPGPEHAWAPSAHGHALVELVVPLVRQPRAERRGPFVAQSPSDGSDATPGHDRAPRPFTAAVEPVLERMRPPGSDWLYLKLYGDAAREEALLAGPVQAFCQARVRASRCAMWFFIRYADPEPHLRIRFRGDPNRLVDELLPEVCDWAAQLMVSRQIARFAMDTYEREVTRYGGPGGVAWAEAFFFIDSAATGDLLGRLIGELERGPKIDRLSLAAISIDRMLADLGLCPDERLRWCRAQVGSRHASGEPYRQAKVALRAWFSPLQRTMHWPGWLPDLLDERGRSLLALGVRRRALLDRGEASGNGESVLRSLVHMHCNRLLGIDSGGEEKALGMLLRLRESLARFPIAE